MARSSASASVASKQLRRATNSKYERVVIHVSSMVADVRRLRTACDSIRACRGEGYVSSARWEARGRAAETRSSEVVASSAQRLYR
jgi:hypothetical protein